MLVSRTKPVPAFRLVGPPGLLRIDHEAILFFRQEIHPGASREIIWRLGAAVKHDYQGKQLSLSAARDEKLVGAASSRAAESASDEPCVRGCDIPRGGRRARHRTAQIKPGE